VARGGRRKNYRFWEFSRSHLSPKVIATVWDAFFNLKLAETDQSQFLSLALRRTTMLHHVTRVSVSALPDYVELF
jgi:hypothetical protein